MRFGDLIISVGYDPDVGPAVQITPRNPLDIRQLHEARDLATIIDPDPDFAFGSSQVIPYTDHVDERIVALIDLLAGIRCNMPHTIQLTLDLDVDQNAELERLLQTALPGVTL